MNIKEIYEQLLKCNFIDEVGNDIKNNVAFIRLKDLASINYQPKYGLNEKVIFNGKEKYIFSIRVSPNSYPNANVEYLLSDVYNRESTTNESNSYWLAESLIFKKDEYDKLQIKIAKDVLEKNGFKILKL